MYIGGYQTETGLIIRQAKEQGMKVTLVGGDALVTNEFWQITGDTGEGTLMTFPSDPRKRPTAAAVVKEFTDKGIDPEGYVLYTYAAIQEWAQAADESRHDRPQEGRRRAARRHLAHRAGPALLRQQGRREGQRLRLLRLAQRQIRRDVRPASRCEDGVRQPQRRRSRRRGGRRILAARVRP